MKTAAIAAVLLLSPLAHAQRDISVDNGEAQTAYCRMVMEQGKAQRDLLRSPQATVGPIQPSAGTPPQMVFGVTNSLSDDRKASLTMDVARKTCALYNATTEAQQHLLYALPSIEKDVLRHRLQLIQDASDLLDRTIADNEKLVAAHNLTRPALYVLQGAKVRLDTSRVAALTGIASPYVPPLSDTPIKQLVADKLAEEAITEAAAVKLAKQSAWDVKVSGGVHKQLNQVSQGTTSVGAYGEFNLTYSLGRKSAGRHLDNSSAAYGEWKSKQFDDVAHQAAVLQRQITDTIAIQQTQLGILREHDAEIEKNLRALDGVDTSAAIQFRNSLISDQVVLRVEIGDVAFRLEKLQEFVATNF
jgi:choline dehydrogenase-like flavoprotein